MAQTLDIIPIGSARSLNELIAGSSADFLSFAPDDCEPDVKRIETGREMLAQAPDAVACVGLPAIPWLPHKIALFDKSSPAAVLLLSAPVVAGAVIRRSAFESFGPLKPVDSELWDWLIRAACAGKKVLFHDLSAPFTDSVEDPLPRLAPGRPAANRSWLLEHLNRLQPGDLLPNIHDDIAAVALRAGLYQWHDYLDESHELAQSIEGEGAGRLGDYWHAIMHRREPDYSNAKYWFRQVGRQATFPELLRCAEGILGDFVASSAGEWRLRLGKNGNWDAFAFVDLCEACGQADDDLKTAARRIQYCEMVLLMNATYRRATGHAERGA